MKRRDLERHLREHGCRQVDEGDRHSTWAAPAGPKRTTVPRHREIDYALARAIYKQLGIPPPTGPR